MKFQEELTSANEKGKINVDVGLKAMLVSKEFREFFLKDLKMEHRFIAKLAVCRSCWSQVPAKLNKKINDKLIELDEAGEFNNIEKPKKIVKKVKTFHSGANDFDVVDWLESIETTPNSAINSHKLQSTLVFTYYVAE